MSTELDPKTNAFSGNAGAAALIGSPIGMTTAGETQVFGNVPSERAEQHIAQATVGSVDLRGHDADAGSSTISAILDRAGTIDPAPANDQPVTAASGPEGEANGAVSTEATVQDSQYSMQKSALPVADAQIAPVADPHADPAGQAIADQFEQIIAGSAAADHAADRPIAGIDDAASDGGMMGSLDVGGIDLGAATQVTDVSRVVDPFASGDASPLGDAATAGDGQNQHLGLLLPLSEFALDVGPKDLSVNRKGSSDSFTVNELVPGDSDQGGGEAPPPLSPDRDRPDHETIFPSDTQRDTDTSVKYDAGSENLAEPIVSSGAAFWTVAVDRLDGSGPSIPVYTAGNDLSLGLLAASPLADFHILAAVLVGH
jgi:hypothetical protein